MKHTALLIATALAAATLTGCASNGDGPRLDDVEVITKAYDPAKSPALNLLEMTGVDKGYRDIELKDADLAKIRKEGGAAKFEWGTGFTATNAIVNFMSGGVMGLATGALFLDWSDDYDQRTWNGAGVSFVVVPADQSKLGDAAYQEQLRMKALQRITEVSAAAGTPVTIGKPLRHGNIELLPASDDTRYCKSMRNIMKPDWKCHEMARPEIIGYYNEIAVPGLSATNSVIVAIFYSTINYPFLLAGDSAHDVATLVQAKQVSPFAIYKTEFPFVSIDSQVYPFVAPIDGQPVIVDANSVTLYSANTEKDDADGNPIITTDKLD